MKQYWKTGERILTGGAGEQYSYLTDDAPEWLKVAVRDAHMGTLPNDWIYAECRAACEAIESGDLTRERFEDYADIRIDIYTSDLAKWEYDLKQTLLMAEARERLKDMSYTSFGIDEDERRMQLLQYAAISLVCEVIMQAWEDNK